MAATTFNTSRPYLPISRATVCGLAIGMFCLQACSGEFMLSAGPDEETFDGVANDIDPTTTPSLTRAETEFAATTGEVRNMFFAGARVTVVEVDGEYVYEGDILLPPELMSEEPVELPYLEELPEAAVGDQVRLAARTASNLWPNNTVYYSIEPTLEGKERVTDAIAHWEANTNLRFVERTTESDYVSFASGSGCSSYVGRVGGNQPIRLASACSTGNVIHEIGHAVGAWHEHSRADRDASVIINWDNIHTGATYNFQTYESMGYDGADLTPTLDFNSIMMYSAYSFSANGLPTIVKLDGSTFSAQRSGLSDGDIAGLNTIYPGEEVPEETPAPTEPAPTEPEPTEPEPEPTEPGTTEPTEPTEPGTTEPTEPGTTEPEPTEPGTTEPEPEPTEPGTTEPEPEPTEPGTTEPEPTEPEYVEGEYYVLAGLRVLYQGGSWFFYTKNHWREVVLIDGSWFLVRGKKEALN